MKTEHLGKNILAVKKRIKSLEGFSLVEIVVASVLLAIIAAGIFSVTLSSKKLITVSSQRHAATEVAETVLENMRVYLGEDRWINSSTSPFSAPLNTWQPSATTFYDFTDGQTVYGGFIDRIADIYRNTDFDTQFHGKWRFRVIQDNTCGGPCDYRKVEVEVQWDETEI